MPHTNQREEWKKRSVAAQTRWHEEHNAASKANVLRMHTLAHRDTHAHTMIEEPAGKFHLLPGNLQAECHGLCFLHTSLYVTWMGSHPGQNFSSPQDTSAWKDCVCKTSFRQPILIFQNDTDFIPAKPGFIGARKFFKSNFF